MSLFNRNTIALLLAQILFVTSTCCGDLAKAVETIDRRSRDHLSDAVIIKKDGELLYQMSSKEKFEMIAAWSVTKSFISLGIGILYDEGKVHPDQPVSDFIPGWEKEERSRVTIRHLLTHTSGIDHKMSIEDLETALEGDSLEIACGKEMINEPGQEFHYNNFAVNLLAGIIERISEERADLFIKKRLLDHLGITNYHWDLDEAGHAFGMCGLHISADELIKLGEFMMAKGVWNGQRLISEEWLEQSVATSVDLSDHPMFAWFDGCGFLWWAGNESPNFYCAAGMLGQYCVIFPEEGIVAVRQHDYRRHPSFQDIDDKVKYRAFFDDLREFNKELENN